MQEKDTYNLEKIKEKLESLGYDLHYFLQTKSTMLIIDKLAQKPLGERIPVAVTDHQPHGIGRKDRVWYDTLYCSVMFSTLFNIRQSYVASFADLIALEVCSVLKKSSSNKSIKIKYPNDIVVNDQKLGGILVKNIYDKDLNYLGTNVGVGINAHYSKEDLQNFSTDYQATSLDLITDSFVERQDVLIDILSSLRYLNTEVDAVISNPNTKKRFNDKWKQASSLLNKNVTILKNNKPFISGKVTDTKIGEGIEIQTNAKKTWISLFESDMKARINAN